jgi:hypothetical protein
MMSDNLYMSPHSMDLTQYPITIVSAKRRNLGRVLNALDQSLSIAPRWYPGKGRQGLFPCPSGQFLQSKPRAALAWWTTSSINCHKTLLRIIQEGVKVEFIDKQSFHPVRKAPKFVKNSDVEFGIQALLQGRRTGTYGDLAPGGHEFLSRSRVQTPQNGKQRLVHALIPLNDATVKRRARYEDLRHLPSTLKPNDFMISLHAIVHADETGPGLLPLGPQSCWTYLSEPA